MSLLYTVNRSTFFSAVSRCHTVAISSQRHVPPTVAVQCTGLLDVGAVPPQFDFKSLDPKALPSVRCVQLQHHRFDVILRYLKNLFNINIKCVQISRRFWTKLMQRAKPSVAFWLSHLYVPVPCKASLETVFLLQWAQLPMWHASSLLWQFLRQTSPSCLPCLMPKLSGWNDWSWTHPLKMWSHLLSVDTTSILTMDLYQPKNFGHVRSDASPTGHLHEGVHRASARPRGVFQTRNLASMGFLCKSSIDATCKLHSGLNWTSGALKHIVNISKTWPPHWAGSVFPCCCLEFLRAKASNLWWLLLLEAVGTILTDVALLALQKNVEDDPSFQRRLVARAQSAKVHSLQWSGEQWSWQRSLEGNLSDIPVELAKVPNLNVNFDNWVSPLEQSHPLHQRRRSPLARFVEGPSAQVLFARDVAMLDDVACVQILLQLQSCNGQHPCSPSDLGPIATCQLQLSNKFAKHRRLLPDLKRWAKCKSRGGEKSRLPHPTNLLPAIRL